MGVINVYLPLDILLAVALGEVLSVLWYLPYQGSSRFRRRYIWTAVICNLILVYILKYVAHQHLRAMTLEQTLYLSLELFVVHCCLEAPNAVRGLRGLYLFLYHALHKLALTFVMLCALDYFKGFGGFRIKF